MLVFTYANIQLKKAKELYTAQVKYLLQRPKSCKLKTKRYCYTMSKSKHKSVKKPAKLIRSQKYQSIAAVVVIVAAAVLGYFLFIASHAASPSASSEAESGTLSGTACKVTSTGASGTSTNNAVQFGGTACTVTTGNSLCGFKTGAGPTHSKVMVIWEENEDSSSIIGNSSLPYFDNTIVKSCGLATNYSSYTHNSLPNYLTMTSGVPYDYDGFPGDCTPPSACSTITNQSIFSQLDKVGPNNWKGYAESMPSPCYTNNSGNYAARHKSFKQLCNIFNCHAKPSE